MNISGVNSNLSEKDAINICNNSIKWQFKNEIWKQVDARLFETMCNNLDNIENFKLMRLIIITANFMVECESKFDTNIKCSNYWELKTNEERLFNEMKNNGIYNIYESKIDIIEERYESDRNKAMENINDKNGNEKESKSGEIICTKLTKEEIGCILLWTMDNICSEIKQYHRKGRTCKYRYFCSFIMSALEKLKYYVFDTQ